MQAWFRAPLRATLWRGLLFLTVTAGLLVDLLVPPFSAGNSAAKWGFIATGALVLSCAQMVFRGVVSDYLARISMSFDGDVVPWSRSGSAFDQSPTSARPRMQRADIERLER